MAKIIIAGYAEATVQKLREAADAIEKDAACVTDLEFTHDGFGEKQYVISFNTSENTFGKIQWGPEYEWKEVEEKNTKNCSSSAVEMAVNEIRKASEELGLMDCEVRSIFNIGLAARYNLEKLASLQKEDDEILDQKMGRKA